MLTAPNNARVQPGENNAFDQLRPLETIMPLLDNLLDLNPPFDKVAEQAMICLQKVGNTRRARHVVDVTLEDGCAELPPNCEQVDAVFVSTAEPVGNGPLGAQHAQTSWPGVLGGPGRDLAPDQVGGVVRYGLQHPLDVSTYGTHFTDYTFRDGALYVGYQASPSELVRLAMRLGDEPGETEADAPQTLRVVYRGIVSDARGYPLITAEEALACAYFTNSIVVYKKWQNKQASESDYNAAQRLFERHLGQASTAPLASSNGLDEMLDQAKSANRHFHNDDLYVR
ncbi:hypothetical protein [Hymenobacter siberiensis]|uniref:hypothetical protein n=1 Tax=Hymenobacter siberiensis TaxID=2848396 RepID=UPI001C1DF3E5|nr:hypothetical protein [Hymenobacter siberiensis]